MQSWKTQAIFLGQEVFVMTSNMSRVLCYQQPDQRALYFLSKSQIRNPRLPIIDIQQGLLIPQPSTSRCFRLVLGVGNESRVEMCYCFEVTVSQIVMLAYDRSGEILDLNQPSKKMCLGIGKNNAAILSSDCSLKFKLQPVKRTVCM